MKLPRRFLDKVVIGGPNDDCWMWTANVAGGGRGERLYGYFSHGGRMVYAHRFVYEATIGPIPDGLTIDHLCRNTTCVNPFHMEAVTSARKCAARELWPGYQCS